MTFLAASRVTAQAPVPAQPPPDQPTNTEPESAEAVNTTTAPLA